MTGSDDDGVMVMVSVRVPSALLDRADEIAERLARHAVTRGTKRSDILRAALELGLASLERRSNR